MKKKEEEVKKSAGMANFSCIWYSGCSASTYVNPGEPGDGGGSEDGSPDRIMREADVEEWHIDAVFYK